MLSIYNIFHYNSLYSFYIDISERREMVYNLESLKQERKVIGAIRRGNWKLIKTKHKLLLFNLEDDESERRNLASSKNQFSLVFLSQNP